MRPQIYAAVNWWKCHIGPDAKQDAGDGPLNANIRMFGIREALDPKQIEKFGEELAKRIDARWDDASKGLGIVLRVDYDPCIELYEAAESAGIKVRYCATFPVKTTMRVEDDKVIVAHGYRAGFETIWSAPETAPASADKIPVEANK